MRNEVYRLLDNKIPLGKIDIEEQKLITSLRQRLIEETAGFSKIFETESGSTYFILDSGQSFRIQQDKDKLVLQPIYDNIFFVDPTVAKPLLATHSSWYSTKSILNRPISITNCDIGSFPIEFGIVGKPEIGFVKTPGTVTIFGDKDGDFSSGSHIGHSITNILR